VSSLNKRTPIKLTSKVKTTTHGGATTYEEGAEEQLYRAVMSCMLWEDTHYEDGTSIADRIASLIPKVNPLRVAQTAIDARTLMKLRHVPLLIARVMAKLPTHKHLVERLLLEIIQRPDEITEFLAIYRKDNKKEPLSAQVKRGLAGAFLKFNEYELAKYSKKGSFRLRDALFLVHPSPENAEQETLLYKKLAEDKLETPDTWEIAISAEGNNKASWERLLSEKKLGDLALIRNLRNMSKNLVSQDLIRQALKDMKGTRVLPFRYLTAATHAPGYEPELESALFRSTENQEKLPGKTILIVDVSGSMYHAKISEKSELDRAKTACALAVLVRELCENAVIYATAGNDHSRIHKTQLVPARRGFALSDAIYGMCHPLGGGGIFLKQVMDYVKAEQGTADRIIVITDEQDCALSSSDAPDKANAFGTNNYIINVNSYKNGIGYSKWIHINGWSEAVLDFIKMHEEFRLSEVTFMQGTPPPKKRKAYAEKANKVKKGSRAVRGSVSGNRTVRKSSKTRIVLI
jgi:60 kDa SS-A/Ro ribonucleoprotein